MRRDFKDQFPRDGSFWCRTCGNWKRTGRVPEDENEGEGTCSVDGRITPASHGCPLHTHRWSIRGVTRG